VKRLSDVEFDELRAAEALVRDGSITEAYERLRLVLALFPPPSPESVWLSWRAFEIVVVPRLRGLA
jgi:hypothetical protein